MRLHRVSSTSYIMLSPSSSVGWSRQTFALVCYTFWYIQINDLLHFWRCLSVYKLRIYRNLHSCRSFTSPPPLSLAPFSRSPFVSSTICTLIEARCERCFPLLYALCWVYIVIRSNTHLYGLNCVWVRHVSFKRFIDGWEILCQDIHHVCSRRTRAPCHVHNVNAICLYVSVCMCYVRLVRTQNTSVGLALSDREAYAWIYSPGT